METLKRPLLWILGVAAVIALTAYVGPAELVAALRRLPLAVVLLLLVLQVVTLALTAYLWYHFLRKAGAALSFTHTFSIYLAGSFVENVTPSVKIGGEAAKLFLIRRHTRLPYTAITGVLLASKLVTLLPFLVIAAVVFGRAALDAAASYPLLAAALLLVLGAGIAFARHRRESFLAQAFADCRRLLQGPDRWLLLTIAVGIWLLYPLKVYLVAAGLALSLALFPAAVATYSAYLVGLIPLLPGSLGSFEAAMTAMLSRYGLTLSDAAAVTLGVRAITFWFALAFSACFGLPVFLRARRTDA